MLVINPESGADHVHPIELRDAKFLNPPDKDGEMQHLVRAIVKHIAAVDGPLPDIHPLDPSPWHGIKPVRYERFVGRFQEMWKIHSALHETRVVQITGASGQDIAQVTGLGGIGKSLLAREYALRFGPAYPGGVFWLRAYGNDDTKAVLSNEERDAQRSDQLRIFAQDFGIDTVSKKSDEILTALSRELGQRGQRCLWIVDDLPSGLDSEAFQLWCAPHPLAQTLITTRSQAYDSLGSAQIISLEVLPEYDAYQLLTSRRRPSGKQEEEQAHGLANDVGYHALALDVTASALQSYGSDEPYRQFREELSHQDEDALELSIELADALPNSHEKSIAQTMLRSIRGLGPEGLDFLRLASVLAVGPIPALLVTAVFENADDLEHGKAEQHQRKAFHDVTSASLAETAGENQDARTVHTLVSRAVRFHEKGRPERARSLQAAAVQALIAEIARAALDPRLHKQIEFHVPPARHTTTIVVSSREADLLGLVAQFDYNQGMYASAQALWLRELKFRWVEQGPEHQNTLASLNNMAVTLDEQGHSAAAREAQEVLLATFRRLQGAEHPDTLQTMNNLAQALLSQGKLEEARMLQEETLNIRVRVLGPEHPDTLVSMNNLGLILHRQGDLARARDLEEKSLTICSRQLGREHPDTLTSMLSLAETLSAQGELTGARRLQEEVLVLRLRTLGPEHPATLGSVQNLATTVWAQGDLQTARHLEELLLAAKRGVLGPEHPDTLTSMSNLAVTLKGMGDPAGARTLEEEVLNILNRLQGPEHPDTLVSMNNLAVTLSELHELAAACSLQERVLDICRRTLGPEHPYTLSSMNNLAVTLDDIGVSARARRLKEEVLDIFRRVLGPKHSNTSVSAWNLLCTLQKLGEHGAAGEVLERDLRWLLERDPATLSADQREVREDVAQKVKKSD